MPNVIMPNVIMPNVIMPNVIMPNVIMPNVNLPNVIMPKVNILIVMALYLAVHTSVQCSLLENLLMIQILCLQ